MFNPNRINGFSKLLGVTLLSAALFGCGNDDKAAAPDAKADAKTVAITAIVEHPALDAVRQGAIEELGAAGYKEGENLTINFQSAQGNMATAGQIAKQLVADNPDAIIAIATPSAQAVVSGTSDIPVIFSAVTEPVEAKLVPKLDGSGTNVTGASDVLPLEPQVDLIKELLPNVKNIGFVYSPGEVNSTVTLKNLKAITSNQGINIVEAPAQKSSDIAMAAQSLAGKVDVIYTSTDNNVINAYEALAQVAKEAKIPLVSSDPSVVERGAAVALGVNYLDLGRETGKITARILKGEKAGDIPVYAAQKLDLFVSKKYAAEQGITVPQSIIDRAQKVAE
ncbi:ABC transporter substrate-binding protein [Moraxella bovoculi]|uniref:ABC transporter substrate-binding protein n=1 Tax=Moraxella bovoculi TaxID=386891 RepID=A0AAC8PUT3_9GAMM|nr:ABC transporter substrate-binding protein [Moraxella bovoculi]AKG07358.1 ABC transporter substrate-binding protein [Moraxella bovoculi]AKG11959.1 ABC transporter substrate-binding protein [Moraxella bovoculi]